MVQDDGQLRYGKAADRPARWRWVEMDRRCRLDDVGMGG